MSTWLLDSRTVRGSCNTLLSRTKTRFPKDQICRFTNVQKQLPTPFVVYVDFESILKPVNKDVHVTQVGDTNIESSTRTFQEHILCSFAYKIISSVNSDFSLPLVMYRGKDVAEMFVCKLQLSSYLMNISLLQNQCCLLLQSRNRLPLPPPVIYAYNCLKMIKYETIVTSLETIVVLLTMCVICWEGISDSTEYGKVSLSQ